MAIVINGNGIDMGGNPVSNVTVNNNVDVVDKEYVDNNSKVANIVVSTLKNINVFSGTSWQSTGFSASITPTKASNKIIVSVKLNGNPMSNAYRTDFKIQRNGVDVGLGTDGANRIKASGSIDSYGNGALSNKSTSFEFEDTPNSTSTLTYTLFVKNMSGTFVLNGSGDNSDVSGQVSNISTITLMEVS